jgi:hypothetical protein
MKRLFSILMGILVVAAVIVFSDQVRAIGWHGGAGWHRGGPAWHHGAVRWHRWYPRMVPGVVIGGYWPECRVVRRCFVDPYGYRWCRWVEVWP